MELKIEAPNRIDLGGGTTDLYPLYLFMNGGCTVNTAISVMSTVTFRTHSKKGIRITSCDLEKTIEASTPEQLPFDNKLDLIIHAVKSLPPPSGLEIITCNQAPAGSGLGASSALIVALIRGLQFIRMEDHEPVKVAKLAMNIETTCLGVLAGNQDHIASLYGGVSVLEFNQTNFNRTCLDESSDLILKLEQSLILSYTGLGRFSGMNNWEITKGYIDNTNGIREKLFKIRDIARSLAKHLFEGNWERVGSFIEQEWQIRRTLADGISTSEIDTIMLAASESGAMANKICGAGGGGCMVTFVTPERRTEVEKAIVNAGGKLIPFSIARQGVRLDCLK